MPLWLWAVVIAAVTVTAILIVGAIGGHAELLRRLGRTGNPVCPNGFGKERELYGLAGERRCTDQPWQVYYLFGGIGLYLMIVIYRWTTGGRRRPRRWPARIGHDR